MSKLVDWSDKTFQRKLDKTLQKKMTMAQFVVEGNAKKACPVDTGRLRASIHSPKVPLGARAGYVAGGLDNDQVYRGIRGVASTNYAYYVEVGTRYFEGFFYMRRGLDSSKPKIRQIFKGA